MLSFPSTRIRPAFVASAALFAALLILPRAASSAGHGGGHGGGGHSGGGHSGGGHVSGVYGGGHGGGYGGTHGGGSHWGGGGSHASRSHGGTHGGGWHGTLNHGGGWHGGGSHGGGWHGGGSHGGGWHGGGSHHYAGWSHYPYGWGYQPYGWGWGWAPYYSSWWWGYPSTYVVTGGGGGYTADTVSYADERSDLGAAPSSYEGVSEENMDVRSEPLPRPAGYRARMRFTVTPADAAVYVDDKYLGAGGNLAANARGVVTVPGAHAITVARPGYKTKTVRVNARIVTPVDVVVELER